MNPLNEDGSVRVSQAVDRTNVLPSDTKKSSLSLLARN